MHTARPYGRIRAYQQLPLIYKGVHSMRLFASKEVVPTHVRTYLFAVCMYGCLYVCMLASII